jgi:hypothetical protein
MERRRLLVVGLVVAAVVGVVVLVITLAGVALNKPGPSGSNEKPPPLPPLTGPLPQGRGLDWSRAGYREGLEAPPSPAVKYNVLDFGAKGDNVTDDTAALEAAIEAANSEPGVVYFPPGVYRLTRPLQVTSSNVVLRGAGESSTVLFVPLSLADVFPGTWTTNADGSVSTQWLYSGGFLSFIGEQRRSHTASTRLGKVTGAVEQGDTILPVDKPRNFEMGQWVHIFINDASTDKAGSYEDSSEAGTITTFSTRRRRLRAAPSGSIAAWIYGDNLADSGRGTVLNKDEVHFTAKVAAIGNDWVALDRPLPFPVRSSWVADVHRFDPTIQDSGVEQLTIQFAHTLVGPHLTERGYNGIEFAWAGNVWVRQVTVLNSDNGVRFRRVDRSLISDLTVGVTEPRWNTGSPGTPGMNGHHAVSVTEGHDNLITRFNISATFHHDITLASGALQNVVSNGTGADLVIDLHRAASYGNLFARLDLGKGSRPFKSGGRDDRGAHTGRQTTFWNLGTPPRGDPPPRPPPPPPSPAPPPALAPAPAPAAAGQPGEQQARGSEMPRRLLGIGSVGAASSSGSGGLSQQQQQQQQQQVAAQRRRLQDGEPATVALPPCGFGPQLNFIGSFDGDSLCGSMQWLVQPLGEDAPADLHRGQVSERVARSALSAAAG